MNELNNQIAQFFSDPAFKIIFLLWALFWKGLALWKTASKRHLLWFIFILVFNTLGILEILYIFWLNRWDIDKGRLLSYLEKKGKTE
ncbi:hypothetical protein KKA69_03495 [Patescibacteria group bacterium]|nr:hypothetical protein [Patescibacteria group bacterium]